MYIRPSLPNCCLYFSFHIFNGLYCTSFANSTSFFPSPCFWNALRTSPILLLSLRSDRRPERVCYFSSRSVILDQDKHKTNFPSSNWQCAVSLSLPLLKSLLCSTLRLTFFGLHSKRFIYILNQNSTIFFYYEWCFFTAVKFLTYSWSQQITVGSLIHNTEFDCLF